MLRAGKQCILIIAAMLAASQVSAKNGFDIGGALIPADEILAGGPPRDGIPSIDEPKFASANNADFMHDDDYVIGVVIKGEARAYPIKILNWHEVVNDEINGERIAVTFCPLCGSGVVFDSARAKDGAALAGDGALEFGVSGLLYNSDVLLYDRQSESLWSQLMRRAVSGEMKGKDLKALPAEHTTFGEWKQRHPQTKVLTTETGFERDYTRDPYQGYETSPGIYFPLSAKPDTEEFPQKERVLGVSVGDARKAYPFSELAKSDSTTITDTIGGEQITIIWSPQTRTARLSGEGDAITAFWFAWYAFNPQTEIYRAK